MLIIENPSLPSVLQMRAATTSVFSMIDIYRGSARVFLGAGAFLFWLWAQQLMRVANMSDCSHPDATDPLEKRARQ